MAYTTVSEAEFASLEGLDGWRYVNGAIHATFRAGSFRAAAELASAVAAAADAVDHHPDMEVRYPDHLRVVLTTHAVGGLTTHDIELARTISRLAQRAGATSD